MKRPNLVRYKIFTEILLSLKLVLIGYKNYYSTFQTVLGLVFLIRVAENF